MDDYPSPSIEVHELHHDLSNDEACSLVDRILGAPDAWPELIRWRLERDSQRDWKVEFGHVLRTAEEHGFLEPLLGRLRRARRVHARFRGQRHPNDKAHLDLMAELTAATAVHYFVGTGWCFSAWEPKTSLRDVDVELVTPSGGRAVLQAKTPDQPGVIAGHRIVDGERDAHILTALEHGRRQLEGADVPSIILVSAQRRRSLAANSDFVTAHLVGLTTQVGSTIFQATDDLGCFASSEWRHIGAVVFLDHLRGLDRFTYTCTALLNPWANPKARCERGWFPRTRVYWADEQRLYWQAGPPEGQIYETVEISAPWWRRPRARPAA